MKEQAKLYESKARSRNWEQHATIYGDSPEHESIRKLLAASGPAPLLARVRVNRVAAETALGLKRLTLETGVLAASQSLSTRQDEQAKQRCFLRASITPSSLFHSSSHPVLFTLSASPL